MTFPEDAKLGSARPHRLVRIGLLLIWIAAFPLLGLIYLKLEPSPDQAQFDYMGWMATQGFPFYAESFDMNWPGGMFLHKAAIQLFGAVPWSWHILDYLLMQLATLGGAIFLVRSGFRLAPWIFMVLYPPLYITATGWMAGQRDIVAMGILVIAGALMLSGPRREAAALCLAGALVGMAVLVRPTYLSALVGLVALELLPRTWIKWPRRTTAWRRAIALLGGFLLVGIATLIWAASSGFLDDWYEQSFVFTAYVYYGEPPINLIVTAVTVFLRSWHWISLCGAIGLVLWILRDRQVSYPLLLCLGLLTAVAVSFVAQNKGFGYHLGGALLLLVVLSAVALDQLVERTRQAASAIQRFLTGGFAAALVALALVGTAAKLSSLRALVADVPINGVKPVVGSYDLSAAMQDQIVQIIRAESSPSDRMVLYGTAYHVPYLAQRLPAYRYITPAIELITPDFPMHDAWMAEIGAGLQRYRPKFILVTGIPLSTDGTLTLSETDKRPVLAKLVQFMADDYTVRVGSAEDTLFERVTE
jgi:hypothetical protein